MTPMYLKCSILLPVLLLLACGGNNVPGEVSPSADTVKAAPRHEPPLDTVVIENGHAKMLSPDGRLLMEGDMKDGKRNGVWTSYTAEGRVKSRNEYRQGMLEGVATVFRENGALYYTGQHRHGNQVGEWRFYDAKGELERTVDYDTSGAVINDH